MTLIGFRKKRLKKKWRAQLFLVVIYQWMELFFSLFFFLFLTHPIGHIVQPPGGERDVKVAREQRTQQHFFSSLKQKSCLNLLHHRDLLKKIQFLLFKKMAFFWSPQ